MSALKAAGRNHPHPQASAVCENTLQRVSGLSYSPVPTSGQTGLEISYPEFRVPGFFYLPLIYLFFQVLLEMRSLCWALASGAAGFLLHKLNKKQSLPDVLRARGESQELSSRVLTPF